MILRFEKPDDPEIRYKPEKTAVFNVYLCPVCNEVWEELNYWSDNKNYEKHEDFPKHGLEQRKCPECDPELMAFYIERNEVRKKKARDREREKRILNAES